MPAACLSPSCCRGGAKPEKLAVQQITKVELIVNLKNGPFLPISDVRSDGGFRVDSGLVVLTWSFVAIDPSLWTGRALQAESSEWLVLRICIRPLRGADRSWPSWISARVRSHSEIGPRRPVGSPDHERDGETVFHFSNPTCRPRRVSTTTKWSSRIDWSHPFGATVARSPPIGERRWRRRVAVIPLVNQSELISLLR
jgi:hypothetical protein